MDNFNNQGDVVDHVAAADIASSDAVMMETMVGYAVSNIASGETGAVQITGVVRAAKATGTAWTQGLVLNWNDTAKEWQTTTTDADGAGRAAADAESADAIGKVLLTP